VASVAVAAGGRIHYILAPLQMPLALVTGGAVRVGRAISLALGRAGYDVVVHCRTSVDEAEAVHAELTALGRRCHVEPEDLATPEGPAALARRVSAAHPALDLLVLSAAAYEHRDFALVRPEHLERQLQVNLKAPFFLLQGLLPALRQAPAPSVVAITDMAVTHAYTTSHFFSHYLASKAALAQLVRTWALELGPQVRVNAVAPGPVAFAAETTSAQRSEILARVPLRREGRPEDVAQAVVFLAQAPYVTGHSLVVDGGLSIA
jgi:pteridine reductase